MRLFLYLITLFAYGIAYSLTWGADLPSNYEITPGSVEEDFEDITDWTIAQSCGSTFTLSTLRVKSGNTSAMYSMPSGSCGITATKVISKVFNYNLIGFWFFVDSAPNNNLSTLTVRVCQNSGCTIRFEKAFTSANKRFITGGWNWVVVHRDDFTNTGGNTWESTQDRLTVAVTTNSSGAGKFWIDDYSVGFYNRPKVVLRFDDGSSTQTIPLDNAATLGLPVSVCVIGSNLGDATHHTVSSLQTWQAQGHEICNHTWSHQNVTTLGEIPFIEDANVMASFMESNRFEGSRILAYPNSDSIKTNMTLLNDYLFAAGDSTLEIQTYNKGFASPYRVYVKNVGDPSVSLAQAQTWVRDAIRYGGVLIAIFHNFEVADPPVSVNNWSLIRMQAFYDWLLTMTDQIDVVRQRELIIGVSDPRKVRP